jgi:hypothetical protein
VAGPLLLGQLPSNTLTALDLGHVVDYACEQETQSPLPPLLLLHCFDVAGFAAQHLLL